MRLYESYLSNFRFSMGRRLMKFTLKDYQEEAVENVLVNLKKASRRWREDGDKHAFSLTATWSAPLGLDRWGGSRLTGAGLSEEEGLCPDTAATASTSSVRSLPSTTPGRRCTRSADAMTCLAT